MRKINRTVKAILISLAGVTAWALFALYLFMGGATIAKRSHLSNAEKEKIASVCHIRLENTDSIAYIKLLSDTDGSFYVIKIENEPDFKANNPSVTNCHPLNKMPYPFPTAKYLPVDGTYTVYQDGDDYYLSTYAYSAPTKELYDFF